ncbi:methyl-accepting chemotaxis protein [Marinobacter sp. UBA2498]|nr:methyl-accepting chemotaxis protein [Marinobacter sp. UBA2498]
MNLINNLSMRGKLTTLVVPALLVILYFAIESIVLNYGELSDMRQLRSMVELAETGDPLTETLQKERGRSAVFFASEPGTDAARQAERDLAEQRRQTDVRISAYHQGINSLMADASFESSVEASIQSVRQGLDNLDSLRRAVDSRSIAAGDSATRYTTLIMGLVDRIPLIIRGSTDPELTREVNAYYALAEVAEMAGRERAIGASLIRSGEFDLPTLRRIAGLAGQQDGYFNQALAMFASGSELRENLKKGLNTLASQSLEEKRQTLFSSPSGMYALEASEWFTTTTDRIEGLNGIRQSILEELSSLVEHGVTDARNDLVAASGIAAGSILIVLVLMLFIIRAINQQVGSLLSAVRFAMDNKDLTREIEISSHDEVGTIGKAINELFGRFGNALLHIDKSSVQLATATEETSSTAGQNASQVKNQQQQIEQVAAATEEMSATSEEISRNTQQVADAARSAMEKSRSGEQVLHGSVRSIRSLARSVQKVNEVIEELESRSSTIADVVDVIRKVADQTNLLALNAAIEAARAGEQGRGFAVVADEVRSLAQRTQSSAQEIETLVTSLQNSAGDSVSAMESSTTMASNTLERATATGTTIERIARAVEEIKQYNSQIATASEQQTSVAEEINQNITSIRDVTDQSAASSNQTASSSSELARLGSDLQNLVSRFRL